jgi:hypothetical protein
VEFCKAFHSGSLLVLPTNIRLDWKSMQVANTRAYYDTAIITAVKSFIVQAIFANVLNFFEVADTPTYSATELVTAVAKFYRIGPGSQLATLTSILPSNSRLGSVL